MQRPCLPEGQAGLLRAGGCAGPLLHSLPGQCGDALPARGPGGQAGQGPAPEGSRREEGLSWKGCPALLGPHLPQGRPPLRRVSSDSKKVSCSSQRRSQAAHRKLEVKARQEQPRGPREEEEQHQAQLRRGGSALATAALGLVGCPSHVPAGPWTGRGTRGVEWVASLLAPGW